MLCWLLLSLALICRRKDKQRERETAADVNVLPDTHAEHCGLSSVNVSRVMQPSALPVPCACDREAVSMCIRRIVKDL
jgi:hypothetical protein